jgi:hypothetical protein
MRKLNEKDNEILRKLAPEASIPTHYRSILPPVSMHFAADDEDLQDRLKRLSTEDFEYLADLILDGSECLLCISPEAAGMFLDLLEERIPGDIAKRIRGDPIKRGKLRTTILTVFFLPSRIEVSRGSTLPIPKGLSQ